MDSKLTPLFILLGLLLSLVAVAALFFREQPQPCSYLVSYEYGSTSIHGFGYVLVETSDGGLLSEVDLEKTISEIRVRLQVKYPDVDITVIPLNIVKLKAQTKKSNP